MATQKIGFVTYDPGSGNGDSPVSVSGEKYEGRISRSITAQIAVADGSKKVEQTVNQAAVEEFVTINATASITKAGGSVTITGTSNSAKLTFAVTADDSKPLTLTLPSTYTAAGKSTNNGATITDDPGASGKYSFSIVFTNIPANATIDSLISTLTVTAQGGQTGSCTITQTAGDPTLSIDKTVINLDANGTAQTFNVVSNTNWTITQVVSQAAKNLIKAVTK